LDASILAWVRYCIKVTDRSRSIKYDLIPSPKLLEEGPREVPIAMLAADLSDCAFGRPINRAKYRRDARGPPEKRAAPLSCRQRSQQRGRPSPLAAGASALCPNDRLLQCQVTVVFKHDLYRSHWMLAVPSDIEEQVPIGLQHAGNLFCDPTLFRQIFLKGPIVIV
jgi:hypothetical protein